MSQTPQQTPMAEYARNLDLDGPGGDYFSAACALHWYCVNWHGGGGSELYAIQCRLGYRPGASENGPEPNTTDSMIYEDLESGELVAEDVEQWIDQQIAERDRREAEDEA